MDGQVMCTCIVLSHLRGLSVRLSGTVGFFLLFLLVFYSVFVFMFCLSGESYIHGTNVKDD